MSSYSDVLGHWTQRLRFLIGGMVGRVGTGHWARAILLPREGKVDWPKGSNSGPRPGGGGDACRLGMSCLGRVGRTWTFPPRSSGSPFSNSASVGCLHPCTSQSPDPSIFLTLLQPSLHFQPSGPSLSSMFSRGTFNKHHELGFKCVSASGGGGGRGGGELGARCSEATPSSVTGG